MAKGTTHSATQAEALKGRRWWLVDADDQTVGRLATRIASILKGKHKPSYTPSLDTGDFVVVVNAEKVRFTGKKETDKTFFTHTMHPGGAKHTPMDKILMVQYVDARTPSPSTSTYWPGSSWRTEANPVAGAGV